MQQMRDELDAHAGALHDHVVAEVADDANVCGASRAREIREVAFSYTFRSKSRSITPSASMVVCAWYGPRAELANT